MTAPVSSAPVESIDEAGWKRALKSDGAFRRATRGWTGSFAFSDGHLHVCVVLESGGVVSVSADDGTIEADVVFVGPAEGWERVFAAAPPPYYQDLLGGAVGHHGFSATGDTATMAAYYGAIQRAVFVAGKVIRGEVL